VQSEAKEAEPQDALPEGVTRAGTALLYDLSHYQADAEARGIEWVIEDWLVRGQLHLTVGAEKRGKSTQAWRRVEAVTGGRPYIGGLRVMTPGRVLVMTEMNEESIHTLLDEDEIFPDWDQIRTMFLDQYEPRLRLQALADAVADWDPVYLLLDPIDECIGLDENGVFNPATASAGFDKVRDLMRTGLCVEGLYHYNNQGRIANSYKFRSKPDHIYTLKGESAGDIVMTYSGRTRAIPKVRRIVGNGNDGYEVTSLDKVPLGRPNKSQAMVLAYLREDYAVHSVPDIAQGTNLSWNAARQSCLRLVKKGEAERVGDGAYRAFRPGRNPNTAVVSSGPTFEQSQLGYLSEIPVHKRGEDKTHSFRTGGLSNTGGPGDLSEIPVQNSSGLSNTKGSAGLSNTDPDACPECGKVDYRPLSGGMRTCLACSHVWRVE
jgi:hypothetical protein